MGFEPTTSCLGSKHSAAELHPHVHTARKFYVKRNTKSSVTLAKIATGMSTVISAMGIVKRTATSIDAYLKVY